MKSQETKYKNMGYKYEISSNFRFIFNIFSFTSIYVLKCEIKSIATLCIYHNIAVLLNEITIKVFKCTKNSIRDARTQQFGEIFFNTMRYKSSETVHRSGYFQSSACKDEVLQQGNSVN